MNTKPNIAIVSANKSKFSETFIHDQVEYLPANVHYLHTDYLPSKYGKDDILFIKNTIFNRIKLFLGVELFNYMGISNVEWVWQLDPNTKPAC